FLDPALKDTLSGDWERRIRELAIDYFVKLDAQLAELVEIAGPDTRVFIASDHGAGSSTEIFFPNALLSRLGYLRWKDQGPTVPDDQLTAPYIFDFYKSIDWPATTAYLRSSSANGIYIRRAERGWGGVTEADYPAFREKLIADLLGYVDPRDGKPVITRVLTREEAFAGPAMEEAPDITLFLRDGGHPAVLNSDEIVKPRHQISGMHRHAGVLVAVGPGLRRGLSLPPRGISDMTPTMLYSLGLPIPEGLEGELVREAFEKDQLEAEPVRFEQAAANSERQSEGPDETMSAEDEATVLKRLQQLGYLD
ncbi:MAG: alkaline phosphatase family protein, partial [Deltaproteobacteria bacterium]|nr:alkaline phosphatase family protein [Deltaproteobacteria bacterium]